MRCKKHPGDLSSSVGLCASCLRERLFALMAAQAQAQARAQAQQARSCADVDDPRPSEAEPPPPLAFPRSVSPYVSRRKSDNRHYHHQHRFYSTPQVAPTYSSTGATTGEFHAPRSFQRKSKRFSILAYLFRSRSEKLDSDQLDYSDSDPRASPSPSWFSFLSGHRRKQSRFSSFGDPAVARSGKPSRISDRGMSPARGMDTDDEGGVEDRSPSGSACSSESSPAWKRTPVSAAVAPKSTRRSRPGRGGHARNMSGFAFCLSPLVRASPSRNTNSWKHKGGLPPEAGCSGEIRVSAKPHPSTAASFCKNRSRKLADFGRFNRHL